MNVREKKIDVQSKKTVPYLEKSVNNVVFSSDFTGIPLYLLPFHPWGVVLFFRRSLDISQTRHWVLNLQWSFGSRHSQQCSRFKHSQHSLQ